MVALLLSGNGLCLIKISENQFILHLMLLITQKLEKGKIKVQFGIAKSHNHIHFSLKNISEKLISQIGHT